jgi:carbonic anhydrase
MRNDVQASVTNRRFKRYGLSGSKSRTASIAAVVMSAIALLAGCAGHSTSTDKSPHSTASATTTSAAHAPAAAVSPADARQRLVEGNARYVSGSTQHPRQGADRRTELSTSQQPFAVILGCADSRTGPELVFDQGLGDLFVVRGAGNVVDDHALGSIEYAVEHLHSQLIVVLGHERCGAVAAARATVAANGKADGHVESIVASIRPAVEATASQDAEVTCKANVRNMVKAIANSEPILHQLAAGGKIVVVGAYYDLDTGAVTFLAD